MLARIVLTSDPYNHGSFERNICSRLSSSSGEERVIPGSRTVGHIGCILLNLGMRGEILKSLEIIIVFCDCSALK